MNDDRFVWIFDRTIFDQIELPQFGWFEVLLLLGAIAFFTAYLASVRYLERRFERNAKWNRKAADLLRRLEPAQLDGAQMAALHRLAGTRSQTRLYRFLSDPIAFESRLHEAIENGEGRDLGFVRELREHLGYGSNNFLAPLVSTRQLRTGNGLRIAAMGRNLPRHHYGTVEQVGHESFTIRLGAEGLSPAEMAAPDLELFFARGRDLEYRFPLRLAGSIQDPHRIEVRHTLTVLDERPRQIRLPLLVEARYQVRSAHAHAADALDPDLAPSDAEDGVLFDLSDGGFALVTRRELEVGRYLHLTVPMKRRGRQLVLMGRVTACRSVGPERWMAHAVLRGLTRQQRHYLHEVVMHEQNRRFKTLARIQLRRAKAG